MKLLNLLDPKLGKAVRLAVFIAAGVASILAFALATFPVLGGVSVGGMGLVVVIHFLTQFTEIGNKLTED